MKKLTYLIILPACLFMASSCRKPSEIKVMSFNIRLDTPTDSLNNWQYRKDAAAQVILDNNVDIIGTQEVLGNQLADLIERLPGYGHLGVGREDGDALGEYCALFYRDDRFEILSSGNFWLNETPEQPGKGWDAACNRIATWATLKERKSGRELFVINTHLDHRGEVARLESVSLLIDRIGEYAAGRPVVLAGDFNVDPYSEVIKRVTEESGTLFDSRLSAKEVVTGDEPSTFHGFGKIPPQKREIIDYIFIGKGVEAERFEILPSKLNGVYVSDHNPIMATLKIR